MAADPVAAVATDPTAEIRSWLPDHAHTEGPGLFSGSTAWTWTTPAGLWRVTLTLQLMTGWMLGLVCPYGVLDLGPTDDNGLRRLRGVLVALDAFAPTTRDHNAPNGAS